MKLDKYINKAKEVFGDREKLNDLASDVGEKFQNLDKGDNKIADFINHLKLFVRMVSMHFKGEYTSFSTKSLLLMIAAMIYFITPIDLIPDFIPALGFTDDITVIFFVYRSLESDIEAFRKWEKARMAKTTHTVEVQPTENTGKTV